MGSIDLHTHSTASDGTDSPSMLIEKAVQCGLEALALTDHDTLDGNAEAMEAAKKTGIYFVPGCELSTRNELGSFHILGLFVPFGPHCLRKIIEDAKQKRIERNKAMILKLQQNGIKISLEELAEISGGAGGRPHMASLLIKKGYAASQKEAFEIFLGKNGKAYMPKASVSPEFAVRAIRESGALPVLAHPLLLQPLPEDILIKFLKSLKDSGLLALEAWHSTTTEQESRHLEKIAKNLGLGLSGGSDYHGLIKPEIKLGKGKGNLKIEKKILIQLAELIKG